jgi:uncharacterized membrane protein YhiD involved in acid resistance
MAMNTPTEEPLEADPPVACDVTADKTVLSRPVPGGRETNFKTAPKRHPAGLVSFFILGLAVLSITAYFALRDFRPAQNPEPADAAATGQQAPPVGNPGDESIISSIFGSGRPSGDNAPQEGLLLRAERMTARLLLAALLASLLAFRPHRYPGAVHRNPYVAQTQILLAVVASALMMIVGDNAARAFGIFAAASLVRFRTNIRDPKEITVLLINLAIGLATGVGRWELAIILSVFVLLTLWVLEHYESRQVVRSMQLKVKTHNVAETDEILRGIFERHSLSAEVRELDREDDENPFGRIVYFVDVSPVISTDRLSEEIFSSDPHNIDTVEWHQKKSASYAYH